MDSIQTAVRVCPNNSKEKETLEIKENQVNYKFNILIIIGFFDISKC